MLFWEKRWLLAVLEGFAPDDGGKLALNQLGIDYLGAFRVIRRASTPRAALGLHLALWIAALAPLWLERRWCSIASLGIEARAALLQRLLCHRSYIVRELTTLLKLVACMAMFGIDAIQLRSGFDTSAALYAQEASGTRRRAPHLPVLPEVQDADVTASAEVA